MDRRLVRRAAASYALAILVAVLFAQGALLLVVIVGAVLLGLVSLLLADPRMGIGARFETGSAPIDPWRHHPTGAPA